MKTLKINIAKGLEKINIVVKNGAEFKRCLKTGNWRNFNFTVQNEEDSKKIKQFAIKNANDKNSNKGNWYACCNGFSMNLSVNDSGNNFSLNTYSGVRK